MTRHLTEDDLRSFHDRSLSSADVVAVSEHLTACEGCRERALSGVQWRDEMAAIRLDEQPHPTDDELAAYVDGTAPSSTAARVRTHAGACAECTEAVADFRAIAAGQSVFVGGRADPRAAAPPVQAVPPLRAVVATTPRAGLWARLTAILSMPQLSLAAAVVALLFAATTAWLAVELRSEQQAAAARAAQWDAERQAARDRIAALTAARGQEPPAPVDVTVPAPPAAPAVFAVALTPGLLRGNEATVRLPVTAGMVQLNLRSDAALQARRYRVEIRRREAASAAGVIWSETFATSRIRWSDGLSVPVPADVLPDGVYVLTLSAADTAASELIDEYAFRVAR